jgi:hypothetical protein
VSRRKILKQHAQCDNQVPHYWKDMVDLKRWTAVGFGLVALAFAPSEGFSCIKAEYCDSNLKCLGDSILSALEYKELRATLVIVNIALAVVASYKMKYRWFVVGIFSFEIIAWQSLPFDLELASSGCLM